jgi:two-component system sensor kinase FixL
MTSLSERIDTLVGQGAYGRLFVLGLAFVAAYVGLDAATYVFPSSPFAATPWNPQPALGVALIVAGGPLFAPAVLLAVLIAEGLLRDAPGGGLGFVLACTGVAATYVGAGLLVRHFTGLRKAEAGLRELTIFIGVSVGAAATAGALYVGAYLVDGTLLRHQVGGVLSRLWIGDLLGLVVATPLVLLVTSGAWRLTLAQPAQGRSFLADLVIFVFALALVLLLVFGVTPLDEFRMSYLLFLPMIAFGLRQGLIGAAVVTPLAQVGLLISLGLTGTQSTTAFEFQLLMLTLAITTLYIGALASERARAAAALAAREAALREQQIALARAQRNAAAAELAATLAHELNQPLSAISNYASASRVLAAGDDTQRAQLMQALGRIAEESSRAGQFVRRMRDFFRTGSAQLEPTRVADLVNAAQAQVRDRMQLLAVRWECRLPADLPLVRVDRVQIGAVLNNLLANALDAVGSQPSPRLIQLRAGRNPRSATPGVLIEVSDNGPGVALEVRDQLFQPMATSKPHGMGLGLAMARTIVERHGGSLWLDTTRDSTTFCLELPAHDA